MTGLDYVHGVHKAASPRIMYVFMDVPTTYQSFKETAFLKQFYEELLSGEHLNTGKKDNFRCLW